MLCLHSDITRYQRSHSERFPQKQHLFRPGLHGNDLHFVFVYWLLAQGLLRELDVYIVSHLWWNIFFWIQDLEKMSQIFWETTFWMVVGLSHPVDWYYFDTNAHIFCPSTVCLFAVNSKQLFVLRETSEKSNFCLCTMYLSLECSQIYSLILKELSLIKLHLFVFLFKLTKLYM